MYKTSNQKIQKMSGKFLEFQASFIDNILVVDTLRTIQVAKVHYWKWWFLWLIEKLISVVLFMRVLLSYNAFVVVKDRFAVFIVLIVFCIH